MDHKCPFAAPLTQAEFHCSHADEVIRRGGTEFNCLSTVHHQRCQRLHARLKAAALPAFGVEDDLLSMPHSVLVKIQFGGLLGMQRLVTGTSGGDAGIADVAELVTTAETHFGGLDAIPCETLTGDMLGFKVARRRGR